MELGAGMHDAVSVENSRTVWDLLRNCSPCNFSLCLNDLKHFTNCTSICIFNFLLDLLFDLPVLLQGALCLLL